jgi:hypothetical protein
VLIDYCVAIDALVHRRRELIAVLEDAVATSGYAEAVARLRCFRGINTLTAAGLCAEVGNFERFAKPNQLSGFLGIVPSEYTSSEKRVQGHITKAGPTHARRLLVESAHTRATQRGQWRGAIWTSPVKLPSLARAWRATVVALSVGRRPEAGGGHPRSCLVCRSWLGGGRLRERAGRPTAGSLHARWLVLSNRRRRFVTCAMIAAVTETIVAATAVTCRRWRRSASALSCTRSCASAAT